jgi:hypothetical protein
LVVVVDDHDDDDAPRVRPEEKEVGSVDARKKQDYSSKQTNLSFLVTCRAITQSNGSSSLTHGTKIHLSSAQSD